MTWSIQLTFWALPPLLAVLVALRDLNFLWPRHRELGTRTLVILVASSGLWAAMDLVSVLSSSLEVKTALARTAYLPASVATLAWPAFAYAFANRRELFRAPMLLLYAITAGTVGMVLQSDTPAWLFHDPALVPVGAVTGLAVDPGTGFWLFLGGQLFAVALATSVLLSSVSRSPDIRRRSAVPILAATLALAPALYHLVWALGHQWLDLSSSGFTLGASVLAWALLRPRLLDLGPVDRTRVLNELHDPIVVMDGHGRIVDVNRAAERTLGIEPYGDVPLDLGTAWAAGRSDTRGPSRATLRLPGGDTRVFEVTLTPLGDRGSAGRSALLLRDVTAREQMSQALEQANRDLERLANTDALTGLANRRHFMATLDGELERSARYGRPLTLLLMDMDHFKRVNDTHGHAAGDDVLRKAAQALRSVCRDVDLAARLGGEELALLLPETEAAGGRAVAERVRFRIEGTRHVSPAGQPYTVTASIGVASVGLAPRTRDDLLQSADEALYRAKKGGRNRVEVSG